MPPFPAVIPKWKSRTDSLLVKYSEKKIGNSKDENEQQQSLGPFTRTLNLARQIGSCLDIPIHGVLGSLEVDVPFLPHDPDSLDLSPSRQCFHRRGWKIVGPAGHWSHSFEL